MTRQGCDKNIHGFHPSRGWLGIPGLLKSPFVLVILMGLLMISCGVEEKLEKTNEQIGGLKKSTEDLDRNLEKISQSMDHVNDRMDDILNVVRIQASETKLTSTFAQIRDPDLGLKKKHQRAVVYMRSFPFHYWSAWNETVEERNELIHDSLRYFLSDMGVLLEDASGKSIDEFSIRDSSWQPLAIITAHLDEISDHQHKMKKKGDWPILSMYDFLVNGLKKASDIAERPIDNYHREVLSNEKLSILLLQLRQIYLTYMVALDFKEIMSNWFFHVVLPLSHWDFQMETKTPERVVKLNEWLYEALKTRKDLRSLNIEPVTSWRLESLYGNLRIVFRGRRRSLESIVLDREIYSFDENNPFDRFVQLLSKRFIHWQNKEILPPTENSWTTGP